MDKPAWWEASGELSGMLNWAIAGLHRLRKQGRFTESEVCNRALNEYRAESNPARLFLSEHCREELNESVGTQELYEAYREWCEGHGYRPLLEQSGGLLRFPSSTVSLIDTS